MDDVKEWFKTYYGPSNVVIVMAGDIDAKTAAGRKTLAEQRQSWREFVTALNLLTGFENA